MENTRTLAQVDPEIAALVRKETERQEEGLELIASENFVSPAVMEAVGSVLTNKYAEGYPGKRYYGGCEFVDQVETLAIERAKKLFGAEAANVQAHSGSQANMAAYMSVMQPGDTMLSLDLNSGGHLTHGMSLNFSGKLYKVVHYGLDRATERIDFGQVRTLAKEHRPKVIVVGASAYPRTLEFATFREIADSVGAVLVVDMAHIAGLVATGLHPSPVPLAELVTTTTHKTLRGPRGGMVLAKEPFIKGVNSNIFPGIQGGPLMHVIAGKAVAFQEALQPEFSRLPAADRRQREGARRGAARRWPAAGLGRDRHPPHAGRPSPEEAHRQGGGGGPGEGGDHRQQEHDRLRSGEADGHLRRPNRHAGAHHPRNEGGGDGHRRRVDRRGARPSRRRGGARAGGRQGARAREDLPALRLASATFECAVPSASATTARSWTRASRPRGRSTRRRRECLGCRKRFTTYERVEELMPLVVKKDGRREPYDREKLISGLQKAVEKRPVSMDQLEALVAEVEARVLERGEKEVRPASWARR